MTGNSRLKIRAIFLSLVMVLSVFGGAMAFAGTAAGATTDLTLGSTDVVEGEEVTVSVTDDTNGDQGDVYVIADKDGDGVFDTGEIIGQSAGADGAQDITADTTDLSGDVDIYALELGAAPTDGNTDITTQQGPSTLSVTPLEVDITPSDATYGDTVNLNVDVTAGGSAYENNVYVAVTGLNNDDTNDENKILKRGSTTSGSYSTSITLDGVDSNGNLMGNYEVVVRNADTGSNFPSSGSNAPGADRKDTNGNDIDANALLDASPDVSVSSVSSTERGSSASISGSVVNYDGSGISGYTVDVRNLDADSSLGTTDTASNGDFATTETLVDAAEHGVALSLFNGSIVTGGDSTENVPFETFNATANDVTASSDVDSFPARISESNTITLTAENADDADNATRFTLSGVELSDIDVSSDSDAIEIGRAHV